MKNKVNLPERAYNALASKGFGRDNETHSQWRARLRKMVKMGQLDLKRIRNIGRTTQEDILEWLGLPTDSKETMWGNPIAHAKERINYYERRLAEWKKRLGEWGA
jgi:hypothetical protein